MGRKETLRKYRASHKDQIRAYQKRYRAEHIDETREKAHKYNTAYYQEHREREIARARKYSKDNIGKISQRYIDNRESILAKHSEYTKSHPDKSLEYIHARRARKEGNGGRYTQKEWRELIDHYHHACLCCGRRDVRLTIDHVIPLSQGGSNNIDNIQPLCKSCNCKKHMKHIDYRMQDHNW